MTVSHQPIHEVVQARILEGFPSPPPGHFPNPGIKPASLTSPASVGVFLTTTATWETQLVEYMSVISW